MNATEYRDSDPTGFQAAYHGWLEHALDYDWWEFVYDDFKERGGALGFDFDSFEFNGFYCQGSGAGGVGRTAVAPWMKLNGLDVEYFALYLACAEADAHIEFQIHASGGRDHVDWHSPIEYATDSDCTGVGIFEGLGAEEWATLVLEQEERADLPGIAHAQLADFFHDLHRALEAEYEYLTSEDAYIEYCGANDVVFEPHEDF